MTRWGLANPGHCKALPNPARVAIWEKLNGPIPLGMRLGWICQISYCGNVEHFCLLENKNAQDRNWKDIVSRLKGLSDGEFFEIDRPDNPNLFKAALHSAAKLICFSVRTSSDGKKVSIYRVGDWFNRDDVEERRAGLPVLFFPPKGLRYDFWDRVARMRPIYWFGMLGGSYGPVIHSEESAKLLRPCEFKGCPFPTNGGLLCHRHEHFIEYSASMRGHIDRNDIWSNDAAAPLFSTIKAWELPHSFEDTAFIYKNVRDRGSKLSDDWWNKFVEDARANVQAHGTNGNKGWGKKKIRKAQRKRPAGWHGNHPEQKPKERFTRDTLESVPQWAPPKCDEPEPIEEENFVLDSEDEREWLIEAIQDDDFSEMWQ